MYRFVISDSLIDGIDISRVGGKRAVLDSFVYFADVLVNNSTVIRLVLWYVLWKACVSVLEISELDAKCAELVAILVVEFSSLQLSDL